MCWLCIILVGFFFSIVLAIANAVTAFPPSHVDAEAVYRLEESYETRMNKTDRQTVYV